VLSIGVTKKEGRRAGLYKRAGYDRALYAGLSMSPNIRELHGLQLGPEVPPPPPTCGSASTGLWDEWSEAVQDTAAELLVAISPAGARL
jgi:hypothetical protein